MSYSILSTIMDLVYNSITDYKLIYEETIDNYKFMVIRIESNTFYLIEDSIGLHCVEFSSLLSGWEERVQQWTEKLKLGQTKVIVLNIKDILQAYEYNLEPIVN